MSSPGSLVRKKRAFIGYALSFGSVLVLFLYFDLDIGPAIDALAAVTLDRALASFSFVLLHLWLAATAFSLSLRRFDPGFDSSRNRSIWFATLLTKYLPGGIWNPITRGGLMMADGVPLRAVTWASILEQGSTFLTTILLALGILYLARSTLDSQVVALFVAFSLIFLFWLIILRIFRFTHEAPKIAACYAGSMASFALAYVAIYSPSDLLEFSSALFGATAAGIAALPAPGGLGVRESVLAASDGSGDISGAMAIAIAARALIFAAEFCLSAIHIRLYSNKFLDR